MIEHLNTVVNTDRALSDRELKETLNQITRYLEKNINDLTQETDRKDIEIDHLKKSLDKAKEQKEGNNQLINKLLGELARLQNDIDWYKRTYEKRSFLGTIREKIFRKH